MNDKILFFTTGMSAGGAERVIATLANALDERGYEVVIVMLKGTESAYTLAPRVKLVSAELSPGLKSMPRALKFYQRLIAEEAPGVVASLSTKSDLIALASRVLFRTPGRLIVSDRADPFSRARQMQLACNALYGKADALVCQSQSVADYYRKRVKRQNIVVIPNPLNPEAVGMPGSQDRSTTVISVGRLSEQKNHELAIKAFKRMQESFPDLIMKIFGAGPLEVELTQVIRRERLERSVTLEGVQADAIKSHADASLFLFTSNFEGYPNALLEAAATGIPSVTTDFSPGTAKEIVEDGVNGYIVPTGDLDAVVNAGVKALAGRLAHEQSVAAAYRVRASHRTDLVVDRWLEVLTQ